MKVDYFKVNGIVYEIYDELEKATELHEPMITAHHGYAIILEELDEAWEEIKRNDQIKTRQEMIQVAAMALRFLHDISDKEFNNDSLKQEYKFPTDPNIAITQSLAIQIIKKYYPVSSYTILKKALFTAIRFLGEYESEGLKRLRREKNDLK